MRLCAWRRMRTCARSSPAERPRRMRRSLRWNAWPLRTRNSTQSRSEGDVLGTTIDICNHSFLPRFIDSGSVVVDLGANHGDFSHAIMQRFGCRVVAVEPVEELFHGIERDPKLELLPLAVGAKDQTITMNVFSGRCASVLGPMVSDEPL